MLEWPATINTDSCCLACIACLTRMLKSTASSFARDRTHKVECFIVSGPTRIGLGVAKTPDRRQLSRSPSTSLLELPRVSFWCFTNSPSLCALNNPIHPVGASSLKRHCAVRVRDLPTRQSCPTLPLFRPPEPASIAPRPSR
jgi:hypothetical protein